MIWSHPLIRVLLVPLLTTAVGAGAVCPFPAGNAVVLTKAGWAAPIAACCCGTPSGACCGTACCHAGPAQDPPLDAPLPTLRRVDLSCAASTGQLRNDGPAGWPHSAALSAQCGIASHPTLQSERVRIQT